MIPAWSIPACAGEPFAIRVLTRLLRVYPRVCGGTWAFPHVTWLSSGLSPRVRGNHTVYTKTIDGLRSIPACAGEPRPCWQRHRLPQVYPRVCGGTPRVKVGLAYVAGLSPRVRGNPALPPLCILSSGSIPACAGEPRAPRSRSPVAPVYPRVCGGTEHRHRPSRSITGLSPRVRGNLAGRPFRYSHHRSIPACAGEPDFLHWRRMQPPGLSPRVRGNQPTGLCGGYSLGSIPACAGEPGVPTLTRSGWKVYPRVCGGTYEMWTSLYSVDGLSPRVRGNHELRGYRQTAKGSIPACAGEPP